jgi:hypothetical protein
VLVAGAFLTLSNMPAENTDGGFDLSSLGNFAGLVGQVYQARENRKATEAQSLAATTTANANLQTSANQAQAQSALAQASAMSSKTKLYLGIAGGVVLLVIVWLVVKKK